MEPRRFPDLADSLEWNLVLRSNFVAVAGGDGIYGGIPPITQVINNSHTLMIGVKSTTARSHWYTGGWAAQRLLLIPSSTTDFTANVQTENYRIRLGVLNLCTYPKHQATWMLYLKIPRWIREALVEIWRYDGIDRDLFLGASTIATATVAQSTSTVQIVVANQNRRGVTVQNQSTARLTLSTGVLLEPEGYYEAPFGFTGSISGSWDVAGSGLAEVREFI